MTITIRYECRKCKKITEQIERIITDNLPDHVRVLQCTRCGVMGVCMMHELSTGVIHSKAKPVGNAQDLRC